MEKNSIKIFAPNLICVCIDTVENGDYIGKFWHQYGDEPEDFQNTAELLRKMDALYDEWDFPQKSTVPRSFYQKEENVRHPGKRREDCNPRRVENRQGEKGTFLIHVKYRQNATWQGELLWLEKNMKISFRSVLELLKLIDSSFETCK